MPEQAEGALDSLSCLKSEQVVLQDQSERCEVSATQYDRRTMQD